MAEEGTMENNIVAINAKQKERAARDAAEKALQALTEEINTCDPDPILNGLVVMPVLEQQTKGGIVTKDSLANNDQDLSICIVHKIGPGFINGGTGKLMPIEGINIGDIVWVLKWKLAPLVPGRNFWMTTSDAVNGVHHRKKIDNVSSTADIGSTDEEEKSAEETKA